MGVSRLLELLAGIDVHPFGKRVVRIRLRRQSGLLEMLPAEGIEPHTWGHGGHNVRGMAALLRRHLFQKGSVLLGGVEQLAGLLLLDTPLGQVSFMTLLCTAHEYQHILQYNFYDILENLLATCVAEGRKRGSLERALGRSVSHLQLFLSAMQKLLQHAMRLAVVGWSDSDGRLVRLHKAAKVCSILRYVSAEGR